MVRNADGSLPVQHAPVVPNVLITAGVNGFDDAFARIVAAASDPDGDSLIVSAFDTATSGSFTATIEAFQEPQLFRPDGPTVDNFTITSGNGAFLGSDFRGSFTLDYQARDFFDNATVGTATFSTGSFSRTFMTGGSLDDVLDMNGRMTAFELDGGAGNDRLVGGAGDDRLYGGVGNDTFVLDRTQLGTRAGGLDHVIDLEGAGVAGGDLIRFTGFGDSATVTWLFDQGAVQRYAVTDDGFTAEFMLQTPNGQHLSTGDYIFI